MKIVLVITNSKRKNLVFVSNELDTYSLEEALQLTREGKIDGAHVVQTNKCVYIRTNPSVDKSNELETLSVTAGNLLFYAQDAYLTKMTPALDAFITLYRTHLRKKEQLIKPVGKPEVLSINMKEKLQQHRSIIFEAADKFKIDPYLLGAILVDEIARLFPFESITDTLGVLIVGGNISIGIAQVKIDTANGLINKGYYNPNPDDEKLPFKNINSSARIHLYSYLIQPKHNIYFAGAKIRSLIDEWGKIVDLSKKPEIIATLYSLPYKKPHVNPKPNERGLQISKEFCLLAK